MWYLHGHAGSYSIGDRDRVSEGFEPPQIRLSTALHPSRYQRRKPHVNRQTHEQIYLAGWRAAVPSIEQYEAFRAAPYLGLC